VGKGVELFEGFFLLVISRKLGDSGSDERKGGKGSKNKMRDSINPARGTMAA